MLVRGLDCLDETPLVDLKPDRCEFSPLAQQKAGDFEACRASLGHLAQELEKFSSQLALL